MQSYLIGTKKQEGGGITKRAEDIRKGTAIGQLHLDNPSQ